VFQNGVSNSNEKWSINDILSFPPSIKSIRVRVVSDIQTLVFGSSLYIRYNTAAHVVNSTLKTRAGVRFKWLKNDPSDEFINA
jgi:hypothetical protein